MNTSPWASNMRHSRFLFALAALFGRQGAFSHDGGDWALSPALFPLLLSGSLALLAFALFVQGWRRLGTDRHTASPAADEGLSTGRVFSVFALCIAYALLLPWTGFFPATALFLAFFSFLVGERRPLPILLISLLSPAAIFLIFRHGLKVLLP